MPRYKGNQPKRRPQYSGAPVFALLFEVGITVGTDPAKDIRAILCTRSSTTSQPSKAPELVFEVEKPDVALAD